MKKKREKSKEAQCAKVFLPVEFHSTNPNIEELVNSLKHADSFEKQQKAIVSVSLPDIL